MTQKISEMTLNNRLIHLYEKYWDGMVSSLKGNNLGNPLLIHIKDEEEYENSDIKIMFFGQETNSWEGELGSKNINELVDTYSEFIESGYGGHFWNAVRDYVLTIKELNPNKSVKYLWNNILKIGKENGKGAPKQNLVDKQKEVFPVIKEEIEILKPDIIIFFTGPYYDHYIKKEWNDLSIKKVDDYHERQLAVLNHKLLPSNTCRTYHPNYLYRKGKQFFSNIKEEIINIK